MTMEENFAANNSSDFLNMLRGRQNILRGRQNILRLFRLKRYPIVLQCTLGVDVINKFRGKVSTLMFKVTWGQFKPIRMHYFRAE